MCVTVTKRVLSLNAMDEPPSTQVSNDTLVFQAADGSQIRIFVEAGGISSRPKLVRALKKAGAIICNDPKNAQIILVDPETYQGKRFIRDWGKDADKVVLNFVWAYKSIEAGQVYNDERWGGFLTEDDGLPLEEAMDDENGNPVPTPRETPVVSISDRRMSGDNSVSRINSTQRRRQSIEQNMTEIPQASLPHPFSNDQSQTQTLIPQSQNNGMNLFPNFQHMMPQYHMQMPIMQNNMASAFTQPMISPAFLANFLNSQNPQFNPQQLPPHFEQGFSMALVDAMKAHGYSYSTAQGHAAMQMAMNNQMAPNTMAQTSQDPHPMFKISNNVSIDMSTATGSLQPSPSLLHSSIGRRSTNTLSTSPPPSSKAQGKRRAMSPNNSLYPNATRACTEELGASSRSPVKQGIFSTKEGGLSFFVQIDLGNRLRIVTAIKKNGGKITNNHTTADYSVLYSGSQKQKTFLDLLRSTIDAGRPAVSANFIRDCVARETLIDDPTPYLFKLTPKKRKRQGSTPLSDEEPPDVVAEERRLERNRRQSERRKLAREESTATPASPSAKQGKRKKSPTPILSAPTYDGPRTPTPPPLHTHIGFGTSGHRYTEHEREYVLRYTKILLDRDHMVANSAIGKAMHDKMPHHTLKSWKTYIGTTIRDDIDALRKRASIAFRKTESQKESHSQTPAPLKSPKFNNFDSEELSNEVVPSPPTPTAPPQYVDQSKEQDLRVVSNYFAFGGGDEEGQEPSAIWARLTSQVSCQTEANWEDFYDKHHVEVMARYNQLSAEAAQENSVGQGPDFEAPYA